ARACWGGLCDPYRVWGGEPIAISAEHGAGLGDLASAILAALGLKPLRKGKDGDQSEPEESVDASTNERPLRLAIVGRPTSGRSTLVNALLGEERMITGPEPGLTRDAVSTDFQWGDRAVRLFDTAGLRRKARI